MSRYLSVLRTPGALLAFTAATVARLPIAMVTLGAVLLVEGERDSYALAGGITACFAIGTAVGTPFWGRMLDRFGQGVVIGPIGLVSASLLVVFALSVVAGAPTAVLVALSVAEGLTFPPISPAMRGAWQALLAQEPDRQAAYALEAVAIEAVFVAGPLLLSLLLVTTAPAVPLVVTAALMAGGTSVYVSSSASRRASAVVRSRTAGATSKAGPWPLRSPRVLVVLGVAMALSAGFGNLDVSVAATAREILGNQALLGFLYLGVAGGSAAGGLWFGSRVRGGSDWERLPAALAAVGAGLFVLAGYTAWMTSARSGASLPVVLLLVVLLFVTGTFVAPSLIMQQNLVDAMTSADRRGEAQSWLNAGLTAGAAVGTALAGVLVDVGGAPLAFVGAGVALMVAALAAFRARPLRH